LLYTIGMFERLFKSRSDSQKPSAENKLSPAKPAENQMELENWQLKSGRVYRPFGGDETDIKSNCLNCGAPFKGVLQPGCEYCETQRKCYMIDITEEPGKLKNDDENSPLTIPVFGGFDSKIGDDSRRTTMFGNHLTIGDYCSVGRLGANSATIGDDCDIKFAVARNLKIGEYFVSQGALVGQEINIEDGSTFHNVVLTDGGIATFGDYTNIALLVLGRNTRTEFGDDCSIKTIRNTGHGSLKSGDYFEVENEEKISRKDYQNLVEGIISELMEKR